MTSLTDMRDVIRGALASFFGFGGRLIARVMLMILAGRAFGIEALGQLGQIAAICEIAAAICVMGLKRSLLDMLSYAEENGESTERRTIEAIMIAVMVSLVVSGILGLLWKSFFPDSPGLMPWLFFAIPAIVFTDTALTSIKFKRIIKWDVWARCITEPWGFLGLAAFFYMTGNLGTGLIIAYVGSTVIAAITAGAGLVHTYGAKPLLTSKPNPSNFLPIIRQSAPVGVTDVGTMMLRRIDLVVLSLFVGPAGAGLYYMVQQLATVPQKVNGLFEPMMSPVIARLHNRLDASKIRANLVNVCRWVFIIQLGLTIPMVVFGEDLLGLFGPEFKTGGIVLAIILLAELIDGSFATTETPLVFSNPKIPPTLLFMTVIIECVAIAALSHVWGVTGAAIGFLIAISFLAISRLIMLKKHLDIGVLGTAYVFPIIIGLGTAAALYTAQRWIDPGQGLLITFVIIASLASFAFLIRSFALTKSDRILYRAMSKRRARSSS